MAEVPVWLNLIDYRKTFGNASFLSWERPNYLPDRELLALPRPGATVKTMFGRGNIGEGICLPVRPAEPFDVKYDKNGFRNEPDLTEAEVAVIGDSYVESPMLPGSALATTRLAELSRGAVANLGQSGYGPQQELVVLKRYALSLHPKWIVWVFYEGNDLVDAQHYEERVSFLNGTWNSMNRAWDRSFTLNSLMALARWAHGCMPNQRVAGNYGLIDGGDGREERVYFLDHSSSIAPTAQELEALQTTATALGEAYELARSQGAGFMVAFAPTKFRVYRDIVRFDGNAQGDLKWWVLNDLPERLHRLVADISPDIRYVDLTPALSAAAKTTPLVFIPDDTHWTADGHRVVAETLHHALTYTGQESLVRDESRTPVKAGGTVDLAQGAMMVRNKDGTIRYWSASANELYGWDKKNALGKVSHQLLHTIFPVSLEQIEGELLAKGFWEGRLIHERRDGTKITVFSRWELQQDAGSKDQSITIVEINKKPPV
ncbi:MAG: PAS domain-containing protein [Nitrospira sp.]|nr:PAS domain-containing protein [Nitrospira sp.]